MVKINACALLINDDYEIVNDILCNTDNKLKIREIGH